MLCYCNEISSICVPINIKRAQWLASGGWWWWWRWLWLWWWWWWCCEDMSPCRRESTPNTHGIGLANGRRASSIDASVNSVHSETPRSMEATCPQWTSILQGLFIDGASGTPNRTQPTSIAKDQSMEATQKLEPRGRLLLHTSGGFYGYYRRPNDAPRHRWSRRPGSISRGYTCRVATADLPPTAF